MMTFVIKSIRAMFFSLDKIIYGLIDDVYGLLLTIARTTIFDSGTISEFASRIYAVAGIFMLFKVSLSIIQYVINPDAFADKEKGFASLGKRILISLVLLVLCPYLFQEAYELQKIILEENTIMNLVFGTTNIRGIPTDDYALNAGKNIQFTTMYTFMQPNYEEFYIENDRVDLSPCVITYDPNKYYREDSNFIRELNSACFGTYKSDGDFYDSDGALPKAFEEYKGNEGLQIYQNYAQGIAQQDFNLMMRQDIVLLRNEGDNYLINYKYGISTAVGVAIVYIFLLFCIDIAARSVKLGFLQMMAPIPILSYIEPKGRDGMFKKWYQMCFTTYASLFIRLFALYLGIYAITVVGSFTDVITGEEIKGNWLLNVFMIIGILMFAKQLPKIIEDILGIKLDGKFTLNPFKKIENDALFGKQLIGAGAAGLAGGAAFGTNLLFSRGKNPFRHLGSAIAGGFSAVGRGLSGAVKGEKFGKNFTNSYGAAMKAKMSRNDRLDDDVGLLEMQTSKFKQMVGGHTKGEAVKSANETAKKIQDTYKAMQGAAVGNDKTTFNASGYNYTDSSGRFHDFTKYGNFDGIKGLEKYLDEIKKTTISRSDYTTEADYLDAVNEQRERIADLEDIKDLRLNALASGKEHTGSEYTDRAITEAYATMKKLVGDLNGATSAFDENIGKVDAKADAKTINGMTKGVSAQIAGSTSANQATRVDNYAQRKGQK